MNPFAQTYLRLSLGKLQDVLPQSAAELMRQYEADVNRWSVEQSEELVFCRFGFPVLEEMERIILLVYDEEKRIIADAGAYHLSARSFLESKEVYDFLSEESDWMYLSHYVLSNTVFDSYPYPYCEENQPAEESGEVLLYTNAYVSKAFRRRGIFRSMLETMRESVLRADRDVQTVASILSMDPDIACFGPDAEDEPYYYSFEKDEPARLLNAEIARNVGFIPLRLEPDDPSKETDGTKLWFCVRKELVEFAEEEPS